MRRKDKEITEKAIQNEILEKSSVCRIGLFDEEYPYVVPMNYGYKDGVIYLHSASEGRKLSLIRKNNKVAFEIEQGYEVLKYEKSCRWTTKYRSVMGEGHIEIITDFEEKRYALDAIMQHHGRSENEYDNPLIDKIVALKLVIHSLSAKQSGDWSVE